MGPADHHAECVVRPAQPDRALPLLPLALIHEAVTDVAAEMETALLHGGEGAKIDGCDDRIALQRGGQRLVDHDGGQHHRRNRVEAERPAVAAFIHTDHRDTIEHDGCPAVRGATNLDVTLLPLIALYGDGRQAGQGRSRVLVRKAADRVGGCDICKIDGFSLGLDRCHLRLGDGPGHDDLFRFRDFCTGRRGW